MNLFRLLDHPHGRHHASNGLSSPVQGPSNALASQTVLPRDTPQMADMTTYQMLDDVNLSVEAQHITSSTRAIAGYVNGAYANWPAIVAKYGRSGMFLLSIDVQDYPPFGAQCLDVEKGDARIEQAPSWVKATMAAGRAARDLRWYPKVYIQESNAEALVNEMTAAGIARLDWLLWTAHFTGEPHICGPQSCGSKVQADATQWTSTFEGASLDASLCYAYFFAGPGAPVGYQPPKPVSVPPLQEADWPGNVTLQSGSKGLAVKVLQVYLRNSGIEGVRGVTVDGVFGDQTLTAVRNFQAHQGLTVDGVAGPKTHAALTALGDFSGPLTPKAAVASPAVKPAETPEKPAETPQPEPASVPPPEAPKAPVTIKPAPVVTLVYVQRVLEDAMAAKLALPVGTILYIPHQVQS